MAEPQWLYVTVLPTGEIVGPKSDPAIDRIIEQAREASARDFADRNAAMFEARCRLGMTQAQLGEVVGATQGQISRLERGRDVGKGIARKVADTLGLALEDVLPKGGEE